MKININSNKAKFLIFALFLFLAWFLGRYTRIDIQALQEYLRVFPGILSGVIFVALYVAVTFFVWFSKDLLRLLAALLFGAFQSGIWVSIAEIANAAILFFLARKMGRSFVEASLKGKYRQLDQRLGKVSFIWLFLFRAAPLIPFRFMDLAAGLTNISFRRYMFAVILGSPLRIFWVQYILAAVGRRVFGNPSLLIDYFLNNRALLILSLIYPVLVIAVALKLRSRGKPCQ